MRKLIPRFQKRLASGHETCNSNSSGAGERFSKPASARATELLAPVAPIAALLLVLAPPVWAECLRVIVRDPAGLPVPEARVFAGGREYGNDSQGVAEICDLPPRSRIIVRAPNFQQTSRLVVDPATEIIIQLELRPRVETPIVVTGTLEPREMAEVDRSLTVLSVEEPAVPAWSFADILKHDTSIDLRERGPDGTQADLSIRGSTFDQVLVLVNGIRMNDVQTGHHNMDLPLPLESIKQVEVLHGSGSTLYGSDAIGGAVNFVTRKPEARELTLMSGIGDFGWNRTSVAGGFRRGKWGQQLSASRDFSTGFREGRDFRNLSFSSESFIDESFGSTTVMFSANDRPFGANGFYGPWDSWEETGTKFVALSQSIGRSADSLQHRFNFAYRRHRDHFILFRYQPEIFQNLHTSDIYQGNYALSGRISEKVNWSGGLSFLSEGVDSTNLGLRRRERGSAFLLLNLRPTGKLNVSMGLREEVWKKWRGATSPTFSIGYWLGRGFKLRGNLSHAYRIPTFTDLYYHDPVSLGNPNLLPENAWNYEAGADWYSSGGTSVSATWFQRREDNTIDWIQRPCGAGELCDNPTQGTNFFRATNFQELTFHGGELQLRQRLRSSEVQVNYTAMRASSVPQPGIVSRYVFNFPLNSLSAAYHGPVTDWLALKTRVGVFNRTWQPAKVLFDGALVFTAGRWRPFFQVTNLLNSYHEAFQGLAQPGRWVRGGVQVSVF